MRINDLYTRLEPATVRQVDKPSVEEASRGRAEGPQSGSIKVTVSDRAKELQASADPSTSPKIAALRESIRSGTYNVDAAAIANKLVGGDE